MSAPPIVPQMLRRYFQPDLFFPVKGRRIAEYHGNLPFIESVLSAHKALCDLHRRLHHLHLRKFRGRRHADSLRVLRAFQPQSHGVSRRLSADVNFLKSHIPDRMCLIVSLQTGIRQKKRQAGASKYMNFPEYHIPDTAHLPVPIPVGRGNADIEKLCPGRVFNPDILKQDVRHQRPVSVVNSHQGISCGRVEYVNILEFHPPHPVRPQLHPYLHGPGKIIPENTMPEGYVLHIPGIQSLHHQRIIPYPGKGVLHQYPPGTADINAVGISPAADDFHIVHQHVLTAAYPQAPVIAVQDGDIPNGYVTALYGVHASGIDKPGFIRILFHADGAVSAHRHMAAVRQH